ncbi:MAG: VOC family protein [Verrucomicrobiales bacterium]
MHSRLYTVPKKSSFKEKSMNDPFTIFELNHVAIHVTDVEKTCRFYSEALKLKPLPRPAFTFPGAWFQFGSAQELHIIGNRDLPVHSNNRGNHFALKVADLKPWVEHLTTLEVPFAPPKARPDGAMQLFLRDPDGHVIELFTPPD